MDLFDDLPEPNGAKKLPDKYPPIQTLQVPNNEGSIFDDLPPESAVAREEKIAANIDGANDRNESKRKSTDDNHEISNKEKRFRVNVCYRVKSFCASLQGERDEMQDSHVIIDDFKPQVIRSNHDVSRLSFYAVYDGHGGKRASNYAAKHLHINLTEKFPKGDLTQLEKDMKKCMLEVYKKTDEEFLKEAAKQKPQWKDGSTATTVLLVNDTLYIANIGDSTAVLCRQNDVKETIPITLTKDHSPIAYEERQRIQKAGGTVKEGRVNGILEVSRSFGDGPYKRFGVSSVPDIRRCQLTDGDRYLIIACDGLWKSFKPQEAIQFIDKIFEKGEDDESLLYSTACSQIALESVRRLSGDNVSVIIVAFTKNDNKTL
ncbi:integrin-linked kinase-associated serine/threonine phosphatase 2C-like [Tubulanus polymorphus]|uniref:integrin-linked kinase-associated serine/threonine phosphatase 2C-like n=1 Tax=Tubulanus polymorphus TaxID=672921 RepID=UPI003DA5B33A